MNELFLYALGIASGYIISQLYDSYRRWKAFKQLIKVLEDLEKDDNNGK